jgi:hypothetical protein
MTQAMECLPGKYKALSLNPSITNKTKHNTTKKMINAIRKVTRRIKFLNFTACVRQHSQCFKMS